MALYTSADSIITFSVQGVALDSVSWDKFSGGGHTADTQNFNPGGHQPAVASTGVSKRNQITLERKWDDTLIGMYMALDGAVNQPCSIGVRPAKSATRTASARRTYTGILKEVNPPENDSTSSTVSRLQVIVEADEQIT